MATVGFDLGTQNMLVAAARQRGIDVLANEASNRQTPAVVCFGDGERALGESGAVKRMRNLPNAVWGIKRLVGKTQDNADFQDEKKRLYCRFVQPEDGDENDVAVRVQHMGETQVFTPTQLAAMLLGKLGDIVESETKQKSGFSVVAVPPYYTERERRETLNAAEIANVRCLGLISEPAAIALGWGIYRPITETDKEAQLVAFVDFGASGFTVSIVAFWKDGLRVLSTAYDRNLGGRDFDQVLFEHARKKIQEKHKIDILENRRAAVRLLVSCESVKKTLSTCPDATLFLENVDEDVDFTLPVTRELFEELAEPLFQRIEGPVKEALALASAHRQRLFKDLPELTFDQLSAVEVVGGSWRIPKVTRLLQEYFGREVSKTLNSEEAVARGAAIRAAQLSPVSRVKPYKVRDANPFAIDFSLSGDSESSDFKTAIPRTQSFPCEKHERVVRSEPFTAQFQYSADVVLADGAARHLSDFKIAAPPASEVPDEAATKVVVTISLDKNGVLECKAVAEVPVKDESATSSAPVSDDNAPAPVADDAAEQKPSYKIKRQNLECQLTSNVGTTAAVLQKWIGVEQKLRAADRQIIETADARNNLESYVLSLRSNLNSAYSLFASSEEKSQITPILESTENWLYDEGDSATKQEYETRLNSIKARGEPIRVRAFEHEERGFATQELRSTINWWRNQIQTTEAKYDHIDAEDRGKIETFCSEAATWLDSKLEEQEKRDLFLDPVILIADVNQRKANLANNASQIMNKPKPAPKPAEPAPAPATPATDDATPAAAEDVPAAAEAEKTAEEPVPVVDDGMD